MTPTTLNCLYCYSTKQQYNDVWEPTLCLNVFLSRWQTGTPCLKNSNVQHWQGYTQPDIFKDDHSLLEIYLSELCLWKLVWNQTLNCYFKMLHYYSYLREKHKPTDWMCLKECFWFKKKNKTNQQIFFSAS